MSKNFRPDEIVLDIASPEVKESFSSGVMPDWFNYKILLGGLVFIVTLILTLILGTAQLYNYYSNVVEAETQLTLKYVDSNKLKTSDALRLSTTGVIDENAGVYHIPIEKAIELVADSSK